MNPLKSRMRILLRHFIIQTPTLEPSKSKTETRVRNFTLEIWNPLNKMKMLFIQDNRAPSNKVKLAVQSRHKTLSNIRKCMIKWIQMNTWSTTPLKHKNTTRPKTIWPSHLVNIQLLTKAHCNTKNSLWHQQPVKPFQTFKRIKNQLKWFSSLLKLIDRIKAKQNIIPNSLNQTIKY